MNFKRLSPLRYPGGKSKILDFIIKLIQENDCIGAEYVEPYAGGAGVALGLLMGGYVSQIHINDFDRGIYSFWSSIITNTDRFIKKIEQTPISIEQWREQQFIYRNMDNFSELDIGFATFYLNRCNRSGIITGGCIGGKEQKGTYKLDARFNKTNLIKRIKKIASFGDKINLYNDDTLSMIKNNYNNFKDMILYLDPPYYVKGYCLYKNSYKHNDHVEIAKILKELNGHWIVSYDNVPEIVDIYSGVYKREFNINYSAGKVKRGKEVMFFSDQLVVPNIDIVRSRV